jgi:hypothetical protein
MTCHPRGNIDLELLDGVSRVFEEPLKPSAQFRRLGWVASFEHRQRVDCPFHLIAKASVSASHRLIGFRQGSIRHGLIAHFAS